MTSHEIVEVWVEIGFAVCVVLACISNLTFYFLLRRRLSRVSFMLSSTPGYLQWMYVRNRIDIRSKWLDTLAISSIASFLAAVTLALVLANLFPFS